VQLSVVQTLLSLQSRGVPTQLPVVVLQASPVVHRFPSSHVIGVVTGAKTQPVPATHVLVVHVLPSSQALLTGVKTHPTPAWQKSVVHAIPSLQTTVVPVHTPPALQASLVVHGLLSLHGPMKYSLTHWPFVGLQ
jgi:hypothetical protein